MKLPPGWNKKLRDLVPTDHGDGRLSIGPPETEWALEYERRLLRPWARFPRDGDIFEAIEDVEVDVSIYFRGPYSGSGRGTLPKGTRVRCVFVLHAEPLGVAAEAIDAPNLEVDLVPAEERSDSKYDGYRLSIRTEDLNRSYRLVGGRGSAA